jgi:hypothetical protein
MVSEPSFSDTAGTTTADNTITWTSLGAVGNYTQVDSTHMQEYPMGVLLRGNSRDSYIRS